MLKAGFFGKIKGNFLDIILSKKEAVN